jgi:peptide/nickel transport system ATP-binding protein
VLEAHHISFAHPGHPALFDDFDLAVAPGERVAFDAPSGTGKTTLCNLLAGYLIPQRGTVSCDGEPLPRKGTCPVQLVDQHPELAIDPHTRLRSTLREALALATPAHSSAPQQDARAGLIDRLGIEQSWLDKYPHELSGGELQRFCLARALLTRPRYLIADEMTTMLDAVSQSHIWHVVLDELESLDAGMVFVTHSPALQGRLATRVITL